jgi:outer membrane lipoprotein carrier protein
VRSLRLWIALLALPAFAADSDLAGLLKAVESRYNKAKTLEVLFTEEYTPPGRAKRTEAGTLKLRKPGRMLWEYSQPKGKMFVSDGKSLWLYTPGENRVEKMKLQASDDMRAPLAFLLGKLNFEKEFRNVTAKPEGNDERIVAEPKGDNLPYSSVEFVVAEDHHIKMVKVTGFDHSVIEFRFEGERVDPPLNDKLFKFAIPKGAEVVEDSH